MSIGTAQRQSFEDRVKRIGTDGPNTMGEVHIGPRDEETARSGEATNSVRMKRKRKNVRIAEGSNYVMVPVALIIGALSVFAGRAAAYHLFADGGLMPMAVPVPALEPYTDYAQFLFAALLALIFTWTFGFSGKLRKLAVIAGFTAMMIGEVHVIERFPELYANFFSKAYVTEALARSA
jgi:hypothetical protein